VALWVVFAGLPGSGKLVLARGVADAIGGTYLRIDAIASAIVSALMPLRDNNSCSSVQRTPDAFPVCGPGGRG
jgi:predicted kinase